MKSLRASGFLQLREPAIRVYALATRTQPDEFLGSRRRTNLAREGLRKHVHGAERPMPVATAALQRIARV